MQFLAFGFGSGLAPKAPGTAGTLVAIPLYLLFAQWSLLQYTALVVLAAVAGVWICGAASKQLQVHDHPGIVWDDGGVCGISAVRYSQTVAHQRARPQGWRWLWHHGR